MGKEISFCCTEEEEMSGKAKYMAKYLPVDGNYKTGRNKLCMTENGSILHYEQAEDRIQVDIKKCKPVKLFVVTHDVRVGDKVTYISQIGDPEAEVIFYENNTEIDIKFENGDTLRVSSYDLYKVLGEISINAAWLDDGDIIEIEVTPYIKEPRPLIKIKCPTCEIYH